MRLTIVSAAVLATVSFSSHGAASMGNYSFDYAITGDRAVRPVQVFDDGRSVYIQLPVNMAAPPAVLEKVGEQVRPIRFRYEFPYLVVDNARGEIVLAFDGRTALVTKRVPGVVTGASRNAVITGAARVLTPPAASRPPRSADPSDYSGEIVFRQMRGSSLTPTRQPVQVAEAPRAPAVSPSAPVLASAESRAAPSRAPGPVRQRHVPAAQGMKTVIHHVKSGETLGGVALQYGVATHRVAADNGIADPNLIRVGQALTINGLNRTIMASAEPAQNIAAVAAPVRAPEPVAAEPVVPPIRVATTPPAVPSSAASVPAGQYLKTVIHHVKSGETLGGVALQYGVAAHRIAADNGIADPNLIRVGQALTINGPNRTIMASAEPAQNIAAVAAPVRAPEPVAAEPVVPPIRIAMVAPHAAPSIPAIARSHRVASDKSSSGQVEFLRVFGAPPKIDAGLLAAAQRVIGKQGEIMLRGHSSAQTVIERSATANASAAAVRDQLIKNGIPADRLILVSNPGRVKSSSARVDVLLIAPKESVDA